jgi:fructose-bisphosphate aldolase class II
MALVTMKEMLLEARREKRAVGAFNVGNYETALALLRAAEQEHSPVIIQVYDRLFESDKASDICGMLERIARRCNQPVALHLDHGSSLENVTKALRAGYTSVMFDGSRLPFEENVRLTRLASDLAHAVSCSSEGEIGHVAQGDETSLTCVDEAVEFARLTGVDALAVSIGTAHGYYKAEPKLDIERCRMIADALPDVPLVLHGGSGTPLEQVQEAIKNGIAKINIATEYLDTYLKSSRQELEKLNGKFLPVDKFFEPIVAALTGHAASLIRFFAGR